jgi:hypothetical protein
MLRAKEHAPTHFPFVVFTFGLTIESIKELGGASQWVQTYHDMMEKLLARGKLKYANYKRRVLSQLHFEIKKLCVMRDYANM